jgi:hypothetical protein
VRGADVVELVNPAGAPVRAWVAGVTEGAGVKKGDDRVARVSSRTLAMLGVTAAARVELRRVFAAARRS